MALTKDPSEVCQAIIDLLKADVSLNLKEVYYGDQDRIPFTPCTTVEAAPTDIQNPVSNFYLEHRFNIAIMVYYAQIVDQSQLKKDSDLYAQQVRDAIHQNKTLNGIIIHGNVTRMEPGVARRSGAKLRAHRLTWEGLSKAMI
jgi:hypothetical protein